MARDVPAANRSRSTANAVDVLDLVADRPGIGLADLARRLELSKSAAHRLVHTLLDSGYLREGDGGSGYVLGYRLIALGRAAEKANPLGELAAGPMRALRDDVNETVHLAVLEGDAALYVEKVESTQVLRHWTRLGEPLPLHCGAAAKCLAAFAFDPARLAELLRPQDPLPRYTDQTITHLDDLLAELERIRTAGFAVSRSEQYEGVTGIAAPLYRPGDRGRAIAAVSLAGPSTRFSDAAVEEWSAKLRATAHEIEQRL